MSTSLSGMEGIGPLLEDGKLADAIGVVSANVKADPTAAGSRILLAELLVLSGAYERADNHLKLAADQAPAEMLAISRMRWLLRATEARRAWYAVGGVPTFIGEPTPRQREVMRLALLVGDGKSEEAAAARALLEDDPPAATAINGAAPGPMRDVCDLNQHGLEALSVDGRYLWIAPEQIVDMRFAPARRPIDLLWRKAETVLSDAREGTFFILAQYWDEEATPLQRLGRETDWIDVAGGVVRGRGQKVLLVGDEDHNLLDIEQITGIAS